MKKIDILYSGEITSFSNDVKLICGYLQKNDEPCVALTYPTNRIKNTKELINSKGNLYEINNHFLSPFLGYVMNDILFYFVYKISSSKSLNEWIDENNDLEENEENKIKAFSMIYQICFAINTINQSGVSIGSIPLKHIMLTDDDHPLIYGYGLPEIFENSSFSYDDDCKEAFSIAQKMLPSTFQNTSHENFCEKVINFETDLPVSRDILISKINPIIEYANEQFNLQDTNDDDFADKSISSETNSQNNNDKEDDDLGIDVDNDDSINENDSENDDNNENSNDDELSIKDNNDNDDSINENDSGNYSNNNENDYDNDESINENDSENDIDNNENSNDNELSIKDNNDNNDSENDSNNKTVYLNEEKDFETSDPVKNIKYWKKSLYGLHYNQLKEDSNRFKKIDEDDNCVIFDGLTIGMKNISLDYSKYVKIYKNLKTKETPQGYSFYLEQNTKLSEGYPNNQLLFGNYNYAKFIPITSLVKDFGPTEKTILVIRAVYSLILVETIYGGHGILNKYLFAAKKGYKSKVPKVRILYSGMKNILNETTNDMSKTKEIFKEIGIDTPGILEKMSKHTSFITLFKDLVTDFSWFHQDSDKNAVFYNIYGYIVNGYHPLIDYHGFFSSLITIESLDLFCLMYHFKETYYGLNINENPVIAVKSRDDYKSIQVLSPDEDQNDEKVSQFQKIDPETLNADDLAYWAYCKVTGNHFLKDVEEGKKLLKIASEKSVEAKYYLALITDDDDLLMEACKEKYPPAMVKIATKDGINIELIQQAALLGNIDAIYYLGLYYFEKGNYNFAYGFFQKASNLNHSDAQWRFAMMLEKSTIAKVQDIDSAECYYLASASQQNPIGLYHYARFEEIYHNMDCYEIYKIAANNGSVDAKIPVIAHEVSTKEMTEDEIYQLVESNDPSMSTELLFRIAYSLPKSKEELAEKIRAKAKSQMKDGDQEKFYARFGLSNIFSCLRKMTELSCNFEGMFSIDYKHLSPLNKVLCWNQDFPNPTMDTISLISQETLIKTPKDTMKIRNKYTKLSKKKEYINDPFFLFFYFLHINKYHAAIDQRLENFINATKEKLKNMNYTPFIYIFEHKKIKENSIIGDGRKEYIWKLIKHDTEVKDDYSEERRKMRMKGITDYHPKKKSTFRDKQSKVFNNKKQVLSVLKMYPQMLYDSPCKFYRFSRFFTVESVSPYTKIMESAFPSTKYWVDLMSKQKYAKDLIIETIQENQQFKMERAVNIISSEVITICTYFNLDHNNEELLNHFDLVKQFDGIVFTKKKKYDGNNLVLKFDIKEIKPLKSNPDATPLEKSLFLSEVLKQLFTMQAIGSKHGNLTKDSFILADDKISIFGCDLIEFLDYLQPETDFMNAKKAIKEIIPDVPKKIIDLFDEHNDFISIYQTVMLNPGQYLYENTPIDEFYDKHIPFQYHEFNEIVVHHRNNYDLLLCCSSIPGQYEILKYQDFIHTAPIFNVALLISFFKNSEIVYFQGLYEENYDTICNFLHDVNESDLNETELAYLTYFKRMGVFLDQEDIEYNDSPSDTRMKLIEQIKSIENEAISDYKNQKLKEMSAKVKQLINVGNENVVILYGLMFKYGIYNPKDKDKANYYLSAEEVEVPFYEYNTRNINLRLNANESIHSFIESFRDKRNITEKDIQKLLSIQEIPYRIEALFTAGYILQSKDLKRSKELRKEAMELYLNTEWSKYSDSLVLFNGVGFLHPIYEHFKEFQDTIWKDVNVNDLFNKGCSAYSKINTKWILNFGEDFNIPEAVTLRLIEREQNSEPVSNLYSDYTFFSKKKPFQDNMFFLFHFALFLKVHKYDKTPETKQFIANVFKRCADQNISPSSGYFYYLLFDSKYVEINKNEGIDYLKKSVNDNLIEAVYTYAVDLATGNYVVQNEPAAKMYLTQIQNEYPPANTYLESHFRRNILDFKIHNDDEISSGSVSEMNESVESRSANEHLEMAKDVGKFMMNFKDWIPLIMSIFRIIQSCSSSIETPKVNQDSTVEEIEENETVRKIKKFFEWATTLVQKIASSLNLDSIGNTEVSVLISVLFTFFFTFMIFSFNTNAYTSFKMLIACTIFIPFAFGIAAIHSTVGIVLLVIGIIMIILSCVVCYLIRKGNEFLKTQLNKFQLYNIYVRFLICFVCLPLTDIILFGMFLERLIPGGTQKLIKKHDILTAKQLKKDTYIIFIISFIVIDLFVLSVLTANTLYIIVTVLLLVVLIVLGILISCLKIDIKRLRITINEIWMYLFVVISESIVVAIIDHLTDDEDEMNTYVKAISSIMSVIYPLILMIFFTYKLYHIWSVTHPTYFRIWIRSTISFVARFGETVKARFFYWTVVDFIYHIIFSIVSAYGGPVANIIVTIIYIAAILLLRPFLLVSDNLLTIGEPIIVCLLNILLLATNRARTASIALGIIFLILAFVPAIVSLIWYIKKERGNEFDFLKKDMIHEFDRVEQKEGLNVVSGVSEIVGYDDYKHLYTTWPGEFTEADIPELDFKNRLIETYGKDDFIQINAAALMVGYLMIYLWIGARYLV